MTDKSVFIHHQAIVDKNVSIGANSRVWGLLIFLKGTNWLGCNICEHVFIESDVKVGNDVTVKCGVQLWDGISLEDNVFGPNATFTNDKFPGVKSIQNLLIKLL